MSEDGAAAPRNSRARCPGGRVSAERADLFIMGAITLSGLYLLALIPLTPALVANHPVWLELLKGSMSAMITMGAHGADRRGVARSWPCSPRSPA